MRVAVVGGNGQLGSEVVDEYQRAGENVARLTHAEIDIASMNSVWRALSDIHPGVIVNTAAMHHLDACETEPDRAYAVNSIGVRNLAVAAQKLDAKLVHISTDYVFDGKKKQPYVEKDHAAPLNVYGNTKLAGEMFLQETAEKYFIVRTSALYGKNPCRAKGGRNFIDLMLKLAAERDEISVVEDEVISPTPTLELAKQIVILSRTEHYGLYHATAEESCSWYEFARAIFEITNAKVNLRVAGPSEFPAKVPRPKYSVLENSALKDIGLNTLSKWQEGLRAYLSTRYQHLLGAET